MVIALIFEHLIANGVAANLSWKEDLEQMNIVIKIGMIKNTGCGIEVDRLIVRILPVFSAQ